MSPAAIGLAIIGGVILVLALIVIGIATVSCWQERGSADTWVKRQTIRRRQS